MWDRFRVGPTQQLWYHDSLVEIFREKAPGPLTEEYAQTLAQSSGAGALWGERAEEEAVSTGRAVVESIRGFDKESIVFVLRVQSITKGNDGKSQNLGDFAVTMVKKGGDWRVYGFQPADAGNLGGG